jgi:hypothetical protein
MNPNISKILTTLTLVLTLSLGAIAQPPPPGEHGQGDDSPPQQQGPIGGGLLILLTLGAAYGAKKVYDARRRLK